MAAGLILICQTTSTGKFKFQSSQILPRVSDSEDQNSGKPRLPPKKPIFIYTSGDTQKDGDVTTVPSFSSSQWHLPAALRGLLRKSTMSAKEMKSCVAQNLSMVRNFASKDKPFSTPMLDKSFLWMWVQIFLSVNHIF